MLFKIFERLAVSNSTSLGVNEAAWLCELFYDIGKWLCFLGIVAVRSISDELKFRHLVKLGLGAYVLIISAFL